MNRRWQRAAGDAGEVIGTALHAGLIAAVLAGAVGILALLPGVQFGLPVGEILTFGPYDQLAPLWHIDAMQSADRRRCALKPAVMAASNGSMVVERRLADGHTFLVHWAGGPTSDDAGNCGSAVDLTLGLSAIQTLVNADSKAMHWHFIGP